MDLRGGGNEGIHRVNGAAARLAAGHRPSPFIGDRSIDSRDSPFESQGQHIVQPFIETPAPSAGGEPLDTVAKLSKRYDAQEHLVLLDLGEPLDDTRIGPRPGPFGDDICVEQKAHKSVERSRSLDRRSFNLEPPSGEALKKSASEPLRWVLRSHSAASTTTTARRPLRVTVCGPCVRAVSMSSLSFALA
jgi:hypothetical protein